MPIFSLFPLKSEPTGLHLVLQQDGNKPGPSGFMPESVHYNLKSVCVCVCVYMMAFIVVEGIGVWVKITKIYIVSSNGKTNMAAVKRQDQPCLIHGHLNLCLYKPACLYTELWNLTHTCDPMW